MKPKKTLADGEWACWKVTVLVLALLLILFGGAPCSNGIIFHLGQHFLLMTQRIKAPSFLSSLSFFLSSP